MRSAFNFPNGRLAIEMDNEFLSHVYRCTHSNLRKMSKQRIYRIYSRHAKLMEHCNKSSTPAHKEFTAPGVYTFDADGDFVIKVRLIHIDIWRCQMADLLRFN